MGGKHSKNTQSAGDLSDNDDQIGNSSQFRKKNQHSSRSNVSLADT